jgi:hypothetical protein
MLTVILMSLNSCLGLNVVRLYRWILSQRKKPQLLIALYLASNSNYEDVLPHDIQYCAKIPIYLLHEILIVAANARQDYQRIVNLNPTGPL